VISGPHVKVAGGHLVPALKVLNEVLGTCKSSGIASETGPLFEDKGSEVTCIEHFACDNGSCKYLLLDRQFLFL
jgi:hypothetical protein